jgi:hypothetical protein
MEAIKMITDKLNAAENETITIYEALGYTIEFLQDLPFMASLEELNKAVAYYLTYSTDYAARKEAAARQLATLTNLVIEANRYSREINFVANRWTSEELEKLSSVIS